jgi:hypothetical protein
VLQYLPPRLPAVEQWLRIACRPQGVAVDLRYRGLHRLLPSLHKRSSRYPGYRPVRGASGVRVPASTGIIGGEARRLYPARTLSVTRKVGSR